MTPTRFSLVILGFALTCSVVMSNFTIGDELNVTSSDDNATEPLPTLSNIASGADSEGATAANSTITTVLIVTTINTTSIPSTNSTNSDTNQTSMTGAPSTTLKTGFSSSDEKNPATPKPIGTTKKPPTTTKNNKDTGVKPAVEESSSSTGLIILIVILILAAVFVAVCCWTRRRGRRYSVDPTSQADGVNIPLSSMEPTDPPAEPVPHNGLQTFESAENSANEPEVKPEVQEEQKAEAGKPAAEPAESAAPAPEAAAEQSPPAPVEPEKTDGGGLASAETTAEPVTGTNENNSNNAGLAARDLKGTNMFWDVPLHSPV